MSSAPLPVQETPPPIAPTIPFWQRERVVNIVSFGSSLTVHLALILIGVLGYKTYQRITEAPIEQPIIPDAAIVENAPIGGIPNPGLGGDPDRAAAQDQIKDVSSNSDNWRSTKGESLSQSLMDQTSGEAASDSIIAPGLRSGIGNGPPNAKGGGESTSAAPFGVPGGGSGSGPRVSFVGVSGNAKRIAYIVDASGSMLTVFPRVRLELKNSIGVLKPIQSFNIFVFSDEDVKFFKKTSLVVANPTNKQAALEYTDNMFAAGSTNPLPAIRATFAQKPELIYILTDGFDQSGIPFSGIIAEFRKLNVDKKTKVNVIWIRAKNEANAEYNKEFETMLRTITSENGGVLKAIDPNEF